MTQIIDRRLNGKNKSAVNRQRFLRRFRSQIKQAVADTGASSMRDMGAVMNKLREQVQGRADMKAVSEAVKAQLAS